MSEYIHALFMYLLSQVVLLIAQYVYSSNETYLDTQKSRWTNGEDCRFAPYLYVHGAIRFRQRDGGNF